MKKTIKIEERIIEIEFVQYFEGWDTEILFGDINSNDFELINFKNPFLALSKIVEEISNMAAIFGENANDFSITPNCKKRGSIFKRILKKKEISFTEEENVIIFTA